MKTYRYSRCCVNCGDCVEDLNRMIEESEEVTYRTMLRHCRGLLDWASRMGYFSRNDQGLTLRDDWHVSYHKSRFQGRPCYYVVHSRIEYIWVQEEGDDSGIRETDPIPVTQQRGDTCGERRSGPRSARVSVTTLDDIRAGAMSARMSTSANCPKQRPGG